MQIIKFSRIVMLDNGNTDQAVNKMFIFLPVVRKDVTLEYIFLKIHDL
jgi:hypothetical protein